MKQWYGAVLALAVMATVPLPGFAQAADAAKPEAAAKAAAPAAKPAPSADRVPVLRLFRDQGVAITFIGQKFGLDGWLLVKDDSLQVVYTTPNGQGAVVGTLYGPTGELETSKQLLAAKQKGLLPASVTGSPGVVGIAGATPPAQTAQTAAPATPATAAPADKSGAPPSERLWKQVSGSSYLKFGADTAPPFYVFMDTRCHFCHDLYMTLAEKYIGNNAMQLRVIPVGILGPESVKQASQILTGADGARLWDEMEHINTTELVDIAPNADDKLKKNHDIMQAWSLTGTPACIYRGKDGKVKIVMGIPSDLDSLVADLGPDQAH